MAPGPVYAPEWLEFEKAFGGRFKCHGSPESIRQMFAEIAAKHAASMPAPDPTVGRKDHTIASEGRQKPLKVRVHRSSTVASDEKLPVLVFFHSGGFIMGDLDTESFFCDTLVKSFPCVIVQGEYRLGPENKHPAAFEDAGLVWDWTRASIDHIGGDVTKVIAIGGSIGATIALELTSKLVKGEDKRRQVRGCIALGPFTLHPDYVPPKYKSMHTSYQDNADAFNADEESMHIFADAVMANAKDPWQFPALENATHKWFPPTYLVVSDGDVLRDDGIIMERVLKESGVQTKIDRYEGMPHYFWAFPLPQTKTFNENLLKGIKFVLGEE